MKRHSIPSILVVVFLASVLTGALALADGYGAGSGSAAKTSHRAASAEYLVESPHTADGCLQALDEISAMGPNALAKWQFGCMTGEHIGWAIVKAADEKAALQTVPASLRAQARVHKLNTFTAAQVKAFHDKMK